MALLPQNTPLVRKKEEDTLDVDYGEGEEEEDEEEEEDFGPAADKLFSLKRRHSLGDMGDGEYREELRALIFFNMGY